MSDHVVLIGLSGSGKSTVGRLLAAALARPLYDTDAMLAERAGLPVPDLLRRDERAFRRLEEEVVALLDALPPGIVATGGGAILSERNRAALGAGNLVIWLRAPASTLAARLARGEERPLLAGDATARLGALECERAALYAACADHTVETANRRPEDVARWVQERIGEWEAARVG